MALTPDDIAALSPLLDQCLALDASQREAWLGSLAPAQNAYVARLRQMLAEHDALASDERLSTLPKLGTDETIAHARDRVGAYCLIREIGRGGMGSVWLAERADGSFKRCVALKLPRLCWGGGLVERMAREREIGALLEHPNIARLYDAGVDDRGRPFIAMEFIDGKQIDAHCRERGLDVPAKLRLFVQVVRAVAYAHGRLVIHRDLKPANVLVDAQGHAHLLDFGIAKLIDDSAALGPGLTEEQGRVMTPHYAAPEQIAGEHVGVQADIYSLGVMLYELLTGHLPYDYKRQTLGAVEEAILEVDTPLASSRATSKAVRRDLQGDIDSILQKTLRREPARRYASAESLAIEIERHLTGHTITAHPDSAFYRLRKIVRRHWVGFTATSAVMLAVLGGSAVAVVQARHAANSAERERVVKDFVTEIFRMNVGSDEGEGVPRQYPAEQLLARGARLIDSRFPQQPELRAELFGVVGDVYEEMGAYRLAADFDQRQLGTIVGLKAGMTERVHVMLRLGEALLNAKETGAARQISDQALATAGDEEPLAYDALVMVLRCQRQAGQRQQAIDTLQRIKSLEQRVAVSDRVAHAWSLVSEAGWLSDDDRWQQAQALLDKAISIALIAEGRNSLAASRIRHGVATALMSLNRFDEAQPYEEKSLASLRALGEFGQMLVLRQVAETQYMQGQLGEISSVKAALTIADQLEQTRRSPLAMPAEDIALIEIQLMGMELKGGNVADVEGRIKRLEPLFRSTPNANAKFWWTVVVAKAAMLSGQHDLADELLRQRRRLRQQTGAGGVQFSATDAATIADNLIMNRKLDEAESFLLSLPQFKAVQGDPKFGEIYGHLVEDRMAHVRLERGDDGGALNMLGLRGETWSEDGGNGSSPDTDVNMVSGIAWCRLGQYERASGFLDRVIDERAKYAFPQDPGLAWARAEAGLCSLRAGRRDEALRLASQARQALGQQPDVSPYYKAPLLDLERALGTRSGAVVAKTGRAARTAARS